MFRVLTVCSGNLCRSPQAEQLLRARIPAAFGRTEIPALEISSAGTKAFDDDPMDRLAATEAMRLGIAEPRAHRARRLREPHVAQADLVLGMGREHRAAASSLVPSAVRRSFTLVEFARILEALANGSVAASIAPLGADGFAAFMRRVVEAAVTVRGLMPTPEAPDALDVEDPYRLEPDVYRRSADAVDALVASIASDLRVLADGR
ncbi:low molecular weight phosphatase family protein [Agrococcus sp. HG114]|uniref:arsenate reductase/protein-tyrosine-phosphatase family protein n=1 Tax=Agrococcus sp. HG114 TaxID=2969757 RepID=UPI00215A17C3|nr:low molecular weight phosphatase family protein [Agrococcus sp. HG114]MCR8669842.1 low molecular weight phosphatase family protein [Agrococcus sp. HG114]